MNEPSAIRLAGTLAVAGLVAGATLASVHGWTRPVIERNQAEALRKAVMEVLPGATTVAPMKRSGEGLAAGDAGPGETIYAGLDDEGRLIGYAVPGEGPGFQDTIRLIFGFDPASGQIVGYRVLESRETPGLGDKIYKDPGFVGDFEGLATDPEVVLTKPKEDDAPNEVDAISGATISSRAVVRIINRELTRWKAPIREGGR